MSKIVNIEIGFGNGTATVVGYYSPPEKTTRDYPGCDAEYEFDKFVVGGVDILDELQELFTINAKGQQCYFLEVIEERVMAAVEEQIQDEEEYAAELAWERHREESFIGNYI